MALVARKFLVWLGITKRRRRRKGAVEEVRRRIGRGCRRVTSRRIRHGYASAVRARLEGAAAWTHATPVCLSSTRARGIFVNLVEKKSPSANRNDLVQKKGPTPGPRRRGISATLPTR